MTAVSVAGSTVTSVAAAVPVSMVKYLVSFTSLPKPSFAYTVTECSPSFSLRSDTWALSSPALYAYMYLSLSTTLMPSIYSLTVLSSIFDVYLFSTSFRYASTVNVDSLMTSPSSSSSPFIIREFTYGSSISSTLVPYTNCRLSK